MIKATYSIKIPYWKIIHFNAGRKVGESRPACYKGLAHYDHRCRPTGKSIRNFMGELNHYDKAGGCTGYSRRGGLGTTIHYSSRGKKMGYTYCFLGIVFYHKWSKID